MTSRRKHTVKHFPFDFKWLRRPARHPLLITVTSDDRSHTMDLGGVLADRGLRHERWTYGQLFRASCLPSGTFIFTDFDRLLPWHVELAGRIYVRLREAGLTVLNDPRRFLPRWALLRRLQRAGINDFACWLPAEDDQPDRFPVFLRTIHAHRGVESDLLHDAAEAEAALRSALDRGRVLSDLLFVEYAAQPAPGSGKFRKHACYGVCGHMIRGLTVTEAGWIAKQGQLGAASDAEYAQDLKDHRADPHAALLRRVFDLAGMDFGRVDYGIVRDRPQIYELNTNPWIRWTHDHPNADRKAAQALLQDQLVDALAGLPREDASRQVFVGDILPDRRSRGKSFGQP